MSAGAVGPPPWAPPFQEPEPEDAALDLIGTWGLDIVDADGLCVSILVPDWVPDRVNVGQAINDAVQDWVDGVNATGPTLDLPWTEDTNGLWDGSNVNCAGGEVGPVDVMIEVRHGGGLTQGTTSLAWDDDGFIVRADIDIRGKFTGADNPATRIDLIARHEFGHAFGVGHWNISGELMSPLLVDNDGVLPNACEIDAVLIAQDWFLSGALTPGLFEPTDDPYECVPT